MPDLKQFQRISFAVFFISFLPVPTQARPSKQKAEVPRGLSALGWLKTWIFWSRLSGSTEGSILEGSPRSSGDGRGRRGISESEERQAARLGRRRLRRIERVEGSEHAARLPKGQPRLHYVESFL
ncbi:ubiquitin-fold modifier 1 isoform X1 [Notamacropus eugenii]|uniref:ubiquitin-fold modifier 1 isoform X1 n=1 Tax=Notamacropus eugenii TaxID=9315 RepID=UPI003B672E3F